MEKKKVKENTNTAAPRNLNNENSKPNKTTYIVLSDFNFFEYLKQNKRTSLSIFIFIYNQSLLTLKKGSHGNMKMNWLSCAYNIPEPWTIFSL